MTQTDHQADADWPASDMPAPEYQLLTETYARARIILEYGSGHSTVLAARLPGKLVFSVESDRQWAMKLQLKLDSGTYPSPAVLYPVDIGPTGDWGRPVDFTHWQKFHRYPAAIWQEGFFRHPDTVLIDGRFRPACLGMVLMSVHRPVRVLFDDYAKRPAYHAVETFVKPAEMVGRIAVFDIVPGMVPPERLGQLLALFSEASHVGQRNPYGTASAG